MKIALTGASGFVGRRLAALAAQAGHEIIGFSRSARPISGCAEMRAYDLEAPLDFTGCEGVIHLAGENVAGLWTAAKRARIRHSRVLGTRHVAASIVAMPTPPRVLVSASASGYYGDTGERETSETAPNGRGFLAEVCHEWEANAEPVRTRGVRLVHPRIAIVYGAGGGALKLIAPAFRLGLGGPLGSGAQWISWIHLDDLCRLFLFCCEQETVSGPINACSPAPIRNLGFTRTLARVVHRPALFPVPAFALRATLGDFAAELLESRRLTPARALAAGFTFEFPTLEPALRDLLG